LSRRVAGRKMGAARNRHHGSGGEQHAAEVKSAKEKGAEQNQQMDLKKNVARGGEEGEHG